MDNMKCKYCGHDVEVTQIRVDKENIEIMTTCDKCWDNNFMPIKKSDHCEIIYLYTRSAQKESFSGDANPENVIPFRQD